jgi:cob(I)alamin adenosyltransferase
MAKPSAPTSGTTSKALALESARALPRRNERRVIPFRDYKTNMKRKEERERERDRSGSIVFRQVI